MTIALIVLGAICAALVAIWAMVYGTKGATKQWLGNTAVSTLVTGLPGNGKTLFVVSEIQKLAKVMAERNAANPATYGGPMRMSSDHVIYTHGIKELAIEGCASLLNPREWHLLPTGSVVVLDEAQKTFVKRANGAAVPPYVSAFETLRHDGKRALLITQHPNLIDAHVRHLVGQHLHAERLFGMQVAAIFEWPKVYDPDNRTHRKAAQVTHWQFPTSVYKLYKSAEVHTVKRQTPKVVKIFGVAIIVLCVGLGLGYRYITTHTNPLGSLAAAPASTDTAAKPAATSGPTGDFTAGEPQLSYLDARVPRLPGLPHTAPLYDSVSTPTVAPKPAACAAMGAKCLCYTQQGTRIAGMDQEMCMRIVEEGWFDDSPAPVERGDHQVSRYEPPGQGRAPLALADVTAAMPAKLDPNTSVHVQSGVTK